MKIKNNSELNVNDTIVCVIHHNGEDHVCITDIASQKNPIEPKNSIKNWMRSRATIPFSEPWAKLHNTDLEMSNFDQLLSIPGDNAFIINPIRWVDEFKSIGFICKSRRGGGTFANRYSAFESISRASA